MKSKRWIMHVDMDAFFASVEVLDNPDLIGKPVIVGGQSMRGVVSTCSYEARSYGVHSAMPMVQAKRLCPNGIYVTCRMERYLKVSNQIMHIFHEFSPLVEQLSIDEAFLDISGMERLYGSHQQIGFLVKQRIKQEIGLNASVGIAPNKFLAKLASDMEKPNGFTIIEHENARSFIAPLAVDKIFGIGKKAKQILLQFGIERIGQIVDAEENVLKKVFGKNAETVRLLALGIDERRVVSNYEQQSIGREITFEQDLHGYSQCQQALLHLSELVGYRLRSRGYYGHTLTLKIKYSDFKTHSRSITSEIDIFNDEEIYHLAVDLLRQATLADSVRLLGITISGLSKGESMSLCFENDERKKQRSKLTDDLKRRFGENVIHRGF